MPMPFDQVNSDPEKACENHAADAKCVPAAVFPSPQSTGSVKAHKKLIENLLFMVLLIFLGTFLTIQIREGISAQEQLAVSKAKHAEYQAQINDLNTENKRLKDENSLLVEQKDDLTQNVLNEQGYSELAASLNEIRKLAGLTEVDGAGVTISLNDSTITDTSDSSQSSLIHSQDVQYIVDLLKASGAKAIAINGERIVCTTNISCTGPTIRVNNSRYPVPFVVTAVCDSDKTYDILQNDLHIISRISEGVEISLSKNNTLTIPAFSDTAVIDSFSTELEVVNP